ncbi:hypothetical protein, partial [Heyndrickxia coagulans]|uniref:hypothetical protein n=2 Tax=Heyndrickxia TaxID=2837504 RepID=UPI001E2B1E9E
HHGYEGQITGSPAMKCPSSHVRKTNDRRTAAFNIFFATCATLEQHITFQMNVWHGPTGNV